MTGEELKIWVEECNQIIDNYLKTHGYKDMEEYWKYNKAEKSRNWGLGIGRHFGTKCSEWCLEY